MKIKTIHDIKKLHEEGRLDKFVVNTKCNDMDYYAYDNKGETLLIWRVKIDIFNVENNSGIWYSGEGFINFKYIDLEATEKLIKGEKEMTKSDLKDGMVVETIIGSRRLVLDGKLIDKSGYIDLINYDDDLTRVENSDDNIIKIYKSNGRYIEEIFSNDVLTILWERKKKSDAEIKLEQIQKQIDDMKNKTLELEKSAEELKKELIK